MFGKKYEYLPNKPTSKVSANKKYFKFVFLIFVVLLIRVVSFSPLIYTKKTVRPIQLDRPHLQTLSACTQSLEQPLLNLFTSFNPSVNKRPIYMNTLQNWASLAPIVQPIVYVDNNTDVVIVEQARTLGWLILPIPLYNSNLPILSAMFLDSYKRTKARYHGYANGDILFTDNLPNNLCQLHRDVKGMNWSQLILVGRRINVPFVAQSMNVKYSALDHLAQTNGTLFVEYSADLFITLTYGFPWNNTPPIVVGRMKVDNWIIVQAISSRIPIVDVTKTIMIIHLTDKKGVRESNGNDMANRLINKDLLPKDFPDALGSPLCAPYQTLLNVHHRVTLYHRQITYRNCKSILNKLHLWKNENFWKHWRNLCPLCLFDA